MRDISIVQKIFTWAVVVLLVVLSVAVLVNDNPVTPYDRPLAIPNTPSPSPQSPPVIWEKGTYIYANNGKE